MGVGVSLMVNVWLVAANPGILPNGFENLFEACEYRYTGGTHHDELHRYRLFVPRHLDPAERYPLLVWMHGTGENGTDNVSSLRWLDRVLEFPAQIERYRFFILVVQCPDTRRDWSPVVEGGDDMLAVTFAILQKSLAEQPIDPDRVYLSGVSSGATACWELAMRHPETFAAVVPMGSAGGDLSRVDRLVQIPIWVFHNFNDTKTPRRGDEETVAALQAAGGNTLLTCVSTPGHNCWKHAFLSYGIMEVVAPAAPGSVDLWDAARASAVGNGGRSGESLRAFYWSSFWEGVRNGGVGNAARSR